jgi:hypothetical protein
VVYDPYTGTFGDVDGDSSLFALPTDEDPFSIPTDDVEDERFDEPSEWSKPAGDIPSGTVGSISYDRGDNEIVGRPTQLDRDYGVRSPRESAADRRAAEELRERARTDTGNRNVRRAAGQHEGSPPTGGSGDSPIAGSIADAATRLRANIHPTGEERAYNPETGTLGLDRRVENVVKAIGAGKGANNAIPKEFTQTVVHEVPTFDGVDFECEIYAVKMNSSGDWLVTVKVPFRYRSTVTDLSGAAGMNLKTRMELDGYIA